MGTDILNTQDCLLRTDPKPNPGSNFRKQVVRPKTRKPVRDEYRRRDPVIEVGRVSLLKRGGDQMMTTFVKDDMVVVVKKNSCLDDVYAGPTVHLSPSPRKLPLPSFSRKNNVLAFDSMATMGLRRILRLDD